MTREGFLANPVCHLFRNADLAPPPDWIRAAWDNAEFRDDAIFSLSRSVSKIGSLDIASDWLNLLGSALSPQQAVELYERIRDESERSESEWRSQFEATFPNCALLLPPVDRQRELFNKTLGLFLTVYLAQHNKVPIRVQELLNGGFHLSEARMSVAEFATFVGDKECLKAIGHLDSNMSLSALSLASALKQNEIADLLRAAGATE